MGSVHPSEKQKQHLLTFSCMLGEHAFDLRHGIFPEANAGDSLYPDEVKKLRETNAGLADNLSNVLGRITDAAENDSFLDEPTCSKITADLTSVTTEVEKIAGIDNLRHELESFNSMVHIFETGVKFGSSVRE